jgi:serine/threonine protein kinase
MISIWDVRAFAYRVFAFNRNTAEIGSSCFGRVFRGRDSANVGPNVAIKEFAEAPTKSKSSMQVNILRDILCDNHNNVVSFLHGGYSMTQKFCMVMELCSMNLDEFMSTRNDASTHVLTLTKHIFEALRLLKRFSILHLDIKPQNILVHNGESVVFKLADFGTALICRSGMKMISKVGSIVHMAPEILLENNGNSIEPYQADFFSFGKNNLRILIG